ncbi:MAG: hypothetical protein A2Z18_03365 [Armatimonadetes bacterium RBG_16_58_9]|nr:MAG: hypothetical protein A2Z18_03365 [Armatimonadetes bacterium RBG_16_58_9]
MPAESSAGIQTIDLNRDGYPEIVVHNHLKQGDHSISSYVYWNGPSGFDKDRRTELPVFGPHFSQMVDPGNLYTRALEEEYISAPIKLPSGRRAQRISWKGESPCGSRLKFQVRSAGESDGLAKAKWSGPGGEGSFYETSGSEMLGLSPEDRWLQYRAVFTSVDGGEWPTLTQVEIDLR